MLCNEVHSPVVKSISNNVLEIFKVIIFYLSSNNISAGTYDKSIFVNKGQFVTSIYLSRGKKFDPLPILFIDVVLELDALSVVKDLHVEFEGITIVEKSIFEYDIFNDTIFSGVSCNEDK